jgi:hypothetical protein
MAFFDPSLPPVQICPFLADPPPSLDVQVRKKFLNLNFLLEKLEIFRHHFLKNSIQIEHFHTTARCFLY